MKRMVTESMKPNNQRSSKYGIGEWYGRSFVEMSPEDRMTLAQLQALPKSERDRMVCPPGLVGDLHPFCNKEGGVCSIRKYVRSVETDGQAWISTLPNELVTVCPSRFLEAGRLFSWIGETMLGASSPVVVGEVGFLTPPMTDANDEPTKTRKEDVGRIDNILVAPEETERLEWCALEIQAVYFSGSGMGTEYARLREGEETGIPFPVGQRRPDFRSSGPKRLMPQLQIKVPTLRRWGKKMAVVVDEAFFGAMGKMDTVNDVSNCDVAWFVMKYQEVGGEIALLPHEVHLTTLERAVEGLTCGEPVSLGEFEKRIIAKIKRGSGAVQPVEVPTDQ